MSAHLQNEKLLYCEKVVRKEYPVWGLFDERNAILDGFKFFEIVIKFATFQKYFFFNIFQSIFEFNRKIFTKSEIREIVTVWPCEH